MEKGDTNKKISPLKSWIKAFRLRTLPLALSSTVTGSLLAVSTGHYGYGVIVLTLFTTLFLQILSNLANDYGDAVKGTDNERRVGPQRSVQSGEISKEAMKRAVILFAVLSFVTGLFLLYIALGSRFLEALLFLVIGVGAIVAAIKYTVGEKAYGYHMMGDLFVLIFFGFAGVAGSYYLNTLSFDPMILLPSLSVGLFSVGVLNLNNMRDMDNDVASGKKTVASTLGFSRAVYYHGFLIIGGWAAALVYLISNYRSPANLLFLTVLPLFVKDLAAISRIRDKAGLDPFLKKLAVATFIFSLLFGISFLWG